ncbi:MAG: Rrf2 family transcriptional regulator [Lachnospiraceae bacterium]|nr:Rrf2 family transcriptional regulator [Lachnospiraceae bacterium]
MHISQKCSVALHCLIFINEYSESINVTSSLLAKSTGCNPVIIRNILSELKKAGIISTQPGAGNTKLAKPPENINLYDVCNALEPDGLQNLFGVHSSPAVACPVGKNIHEVLQMPYGIIQKDLAESLKSIQIDFIIKQFHDISL